jgi:acetoin utilization protein AcuC
MSDGVDVAHEPWTEGAHQVDRAVLDTRRAVFPLHGLDPDDPRD